MDNNADPIACRDVVCLKPDCEEHIMIMILIIITTIMIMIMIIIMIIISIITIIIVIIIIIKPGNICDGERRGVYTSMQVFSGLCLREPFGLETGRSWPATLIRTCVPGVKWHRRPLSTSFGSVVPIYSWGLRSSLLRA